MKNTILNLILITSILTGMSCNRQPRITLLFSNPTETERTGEVVVFDNNQLTNLIGEFPENSLPLFIAGKDTLTSQFVDPDNNGIPDEIMVEITLLPVEVKKVQVKFVKTEIYPDFSYKTNLRFAAKSDLETELITAERVKTTDTKITSTVYQMEGPAWENDMVGFRNYFDLRNGMDIFGKTTKKMVLDEVGLGDNYHELSDWGMDILKVGNSLGAGAIGVLYNEKLYRIGDNGKGIFERIYEGPLRNEFRFDFPDWKMESVEYYINHYISMTSGQYAYKSVVFADGLPEEADIISGIVNIMSDELYTEKTSRHIILFTHSVQAEDGKHLAMALIIPEKYFMGNGTAPDSGQGIIQTHYAKMGLNGQKEAVFYFYSLWETSDARFSDFEYVREYLINEALKLNNPVMISRIR